MNRSPFQVVFPGAYQVEFRPQSALPTPRADEFVLETRYSLISPGTELALYMGTHMGLKTGSTWAKYPFHPGYAAIGRVVARGANVEIEGKIGENADEDTLYFAPTLHESYARNQIGPEMFTLPIPAGLAPEKALFCRLAAIAATALEVAPVAPGQSVAVIGAGLIGNLAAQNFRVAGARVAIIETNAARLEIARKCGLNAVLGGENVTAGLENALGGAPDIVIEATGVPALVNAALEMVKRRGRVVLLGSPRGLTEIDSMRHIHSRGVQMMGAHEGLQGTDGLATRLELTRKSLEDIASGAIETLPLWTRTLPATEIQSAYEALIHEPDKTLGVVLDWQ